MPTETLKAGTPSAGLLGTETPSAGPLSAGALSAEAPAGAIRVSYCGVGDEAAADLAGQIEAVRELGWQCLELRTVDGLTVDALSPRAFAEAVAAIAGAGLTVPVVAARIGGWSRPISCDPAGELAELDVLAERCARLGTRYLRIMSYPNDGLSEADWEQAVLRRIRALTARAAESGLVLLHENCSGWAGRDAARALRLVAEAGEESFGLLFDTGNGAAHDYQPYPMLRRLAPYVRHVHVKDAVGGPDQVHYRPPGEGGLRVADSLRLLLAGGYRGAWSIEPHLAVRPHEDHRASPPECRAAFTTCGQALRTLAEQAATADDATRATAATGTARTTAADGADWPTAPQSPAWHLTPAGLERPPC